MELYMIKKTNSEPEIPQHKISRQTKTRWEDVVKKDALQVLGIRGWRRRVRDREEWGRGAF
jgi:hypothetical protein